MRVERQPQHSRTEAAMRTFLLLLFLLCPASFGHAQTAPAPERGRRVTVNLHKGEAVSGKFLRADAKTVYLEVDGDEVTIALDDVASLVFTRPAPESPAAKAIKALRSLAELAGRSRVSNRTYGNRVLEVKMVVEDQLTLIPEGDLREAVSDTLKAYEMASEIWDLALESTPAEESAKMTQDMLNTTWKGALKRLEQAEALLRQPQARTPAPASTSEPPK